MFQARQVSEAKAPISTLESVMNEAQDRLALLPNYYDWIASRFANHLSGEVLELGCGAGHVLASYVDRVRRVIAADINDKLLARVAEKYPAPRVRTVRADLRGDWGELRGIQADAVIALDVIEHFEDDGAFIDKLKGCLAPGGLVVLKVPAQPQLYGEIDRASGHYRRYDEPGIKDLMSGHQFQTVSIAQMNPAGAWGYRFKRNKRTTYSKTFSRTTLRALNAVIPALALLDHLPFLHGLSLVGIFRDARRR